MTVSTSRQLVLVEAYHLYPRSAESGSPCSKKTGLVSTRRRLLGSAPSQRRPAGPLAKLPSRIFLAALTSCWRSVGQAIHAVSCLLRLISRRMHNVFCFTRYSCRTWLGRDLAAASQ
jgi:hypothetical protein